MSCSVRLKALTASSKVYLLRRMEQNFLSGWSGYILM